MSGFEALGMASSVLQVISFAAQTAGLSVMQSYCQALGTSSADDRSLADIAQKCNDVAEKLQKQVQGLASTKAGGNLSKSVGIALKSYFSKHKVENLEKALNDYRATMETHILVHICKRSDASQLQQHQRFVELGRDVQHFVSQYAAGHTKLSDLVVSEHDVTRRGVTLEILRAESSIKDHLTTQMRQETTKVATEGQRERLLQSLKYTGMNQRRNQVAEAHGTTFRWVLDPNMDEFNETKQSDNTTSILRSVGQHNVPRSSFHRRPVQTWPDFTQWLQSEDDIYWISGKPGSGKSTLIKFLVGSPATTAALELWRQGTIILSHFFWKVGGGMQNSLKGLWSSLAHQALVTNPALVDFVLASSEGWNFNHEPSDWSVPELIRLCLHLFDELSAPLCIFIDGFDEIADSDGASGFMQSIGTIFRVLRPNVKICLAGRSERRFRQRLDGTPELQLHHLTEIDMEDFITDRMTRNTCEQITLGYSAAEQAEVTRLLVRKAEGVFIWLALALESVLRGIENEDRPDELLTRIEHLPSGIDELYKDMWNRLNQDSHVYRQAAKRYFSLAIAATKLEQEINRGPLELLQLAISTTPELQEDLVYHYVDDSRPRLDEACRITKNEVEVRCAGFLEIVPPPGFSNEFPTDPIYQTVAFIHRTAYDYLTTTDHGQEIIGYGSCCSSETYLDMAKGILGYLRTIDSASLRYEMQLDAVPAGLSLANTAAVDQDVKKEVGLLFAVLEGLYIGPFLPAVLEQRSLQSWVFDNIAARGDAMFATYTLLNFIAIETRQDPKPQSDVLMTAIETLLSLGADPTHTGPCHFWAVQGRLNEPTVPVDNTMTLSLLRCLGGNPIAGPTTVHDQSLDSTRERHKWLRVLVTLVRATYDLTGETITIQSKISDWRDSAGFGHYFSAAQHIPPGQPLHETTPGQQAYGDEFAAVKSAHLI